MLLTEGHLASPPFSGKSTCGHKFAQNYCSVTVHVLERGGFGKIRSSYVLVAHQSPFFGKVKQQRTPRGPWDQYSWLLTCTRSSTEFYSPRPPATSALSALEETETLRSFSLAVGAVGSPSQPLACCTDIRCCSPFLWSLASMLLSVCQRNVEISRDGDSRHGLQAVGKPHRTQGVPSTFNDTRSFQLTAAGVTSQPKLFLFSVPSTAGRIPSDERSP